MSRPLLLYVDDGATELATALLDRTDVDVVLLRFEGGYDRPFPRAYLERTARLPTFWAGLHGPVEVEVARFRTWCAEKGLRPAWFLNPVERFLGRAHAFARAAGVPALSSEQVRWVTDKFEMKRRFIELGLPVAPGRLASSRTGIRAFADEAGWPVVVKPLGRSSCDGVYRLDGLRDLARLDLAAEAQWLVESFVEGEEYECSALVYSGRVLDVYPSIYLAPLLAATEGAPNGHISAPDLRTELGVDLVELTQRVVGGLGLDHGYVHLELFRRPDGSIVVGEVSARVAGVRIPRTHALALGFDMLGAVVEIHTGREPELRYTRRRCVGEVRPPVAPGTLVSISDPANFAELPGLLDIQLYVQPGDVVTPRRAAHVAAASVLVEGSTAEEVRMRLLEVLRSFETVVTPPGAEADALATGREATRPLIREGER